MSVGISSWTSQFPPSPSTCSGSQGVLLSQAGPSIPKLPLPQYDDTIASGLRTPPVDDMSTAYQPPMAAYGSHGLHSYSQSLAASRPRAVVNEPRASQNYRQAQPQHHSQPQQQAYPQQVQPVVATQARNIPVSIPTQAFPGSNHNTRPSTPSSEAVAPPTSKGGTVSRRGSDSLVFHSLQIPKCISPNGGNLAEFAAQVRPHSYRYQILVAHNDFADDLSFLVPDRR